MADGIKVMSFNVRYDNPNEAEGDKWVDRRADCAALIEKYKPHIVGIQEPHQNQVDDLAALLPGYSWFGKGRYLVFFGINEENNELNPIFYDSADLTLEASGTFWYSDTPDVPSTQWACSAFPRIATWGRFTINSTGKRFCFVNTHFDHESEEARTKAADLLLTQLPYVSQGLPSVVVGDLNCGDGSPAVTKLSSELTCCNDCGCGIEGTLGKAGTFVGFDKSIDSQIDFVFSNKGFKVTGYGVTSDERENGHVCSDHRPVLATLEFDPDYVIPDPPPAPELAAGIEQTFTGAAGTAADQSAAAAAEAERLAKQAREQAERLVNQAAEQAANALGNLFKGL